MNSSRPTFVAGDMQHLPFADESFDLVMSRHESLDPVEVDRVLAPGGMLLTQQVAPRYWPELRPFFPRMTVFPPHDVEYAAAFRAMGYEVRFEHCEFRVAVRDIGALAYHLLVRPWTIPGFDVETDVDALMAVERGLGTEQGIVLTEGRYLLAATKLQSSVLNPAPLLCRARFPGTIAGEAARP